jgi:hypothetical protein
MNKGRLKDLGAQPLFSVATIVVGTEKTEKHFAPFSVAGENFLTAMKCFSCFVLSE